MTEQDVTPEPAASLGQMFRTARLAKRMTITQMSAMTRIQEDALRAMEEDRYDRLPALVFAKGKVRSYARVLKLDEAHCVRVFLEHSAPFYEQNVEQPLVFPGAVQIKGGPKSRLMWYLVAILVGVFVLALLRGVTFMPSTPDARQAPAPGSRAGAASDTMDGAGTRANAKTTPGGMTDAPGMAADVELLAPPVFVAGAEGAPLVLELRAAADVRVEVRADDGKSRETQLREGERAQWRAHDRFLLTLDNAGMVETLLNGQRQGPFGGFGVVIRDLELRP